jgi:hypothetical protein
LSPKACRDERGFVCACRGRNARADLARRAVLARRIRLLVAATITYNIVEAVIAITAGHAASSTALIGFCLDSVIGVSSAAAVAWQFASTDPEAREKTAPRIIAISFFILAAYVSVESTEWTLSGHAEPGAPPL